MGYFEGKKIIVTGASSGIGEATAKELIKNGAKVILVSRNQEKMSKSFNNFDSSKFAIYPFDLSNLSEIDSLINSIINNEGKIDILFNNAGIGSESYFEDTELDVFHEVMNLDYFSVVYITKSILRHMINNGSGQIVTNTSVAGLITSKGRTVYSSAKFALHGFFDSLRIEVEEKNIGITLIAPGKVITNFGFNKLDKDGNPFAHKNKRKPFGLSSKNAAKIILKAIKERKREVIISKWSDVAWLGVYIRKFFPKFYFYLAKRIDA
mgnify:CR=1 FL=1|tara:strand:+ start:1966 stop:2763 length:798 start_codon:yes stop_codon:yes gene_type:complete